ncbi:serine hydrolase domain-containing protein [Wenzhouxiangella marina]|uniref:Uncharacterized protein n=1 Tax=Wenzhouxiangella marina TaxID=1579979 RepID=A0A0K0XUJ0_9GAMM|nr:serine hydrolase domain-containing protein [Wenzhouxiangella marina]AKS41330.1 hypothetical protein WM2015_949 [Wenzhouxiangella marina]MBB6086920.1 CubicO group peptidase (beta-lactamase class C family) [Wenzhouxiangella marina]
MAPNTRHPRIRPWLALGLFLYALTSLAQTDEADWLADPAPMGESASDGPSLEETELRAYVRGLVDGLMREHDLPGMTLAVTDQSEPRLLLGFGQADAMANRPVSPDESLFRIGSISKTFIWTAAMLLVERGQLDLDRDINDYLTEFQIAEVFDAPVTMNHLMAHRAGFETTLRVFQANDEDPRSLAQALADTQPARVHPPGTVTSYSNWGSALAAHVIEAISDRSFADFVESELLIPLGMRSTTLVQPGQLDDAWRPRMAVGHERVAGRWEAAEAMQIGPFVPAGGIASTASDMARWMRFHLGGGELDGLRLMQAETHALMWSRAFGDRPVGADLAHGFQNYVFRGVEVFGHGGSTGNFISTMVLVPELDLGFFASQNAGHGGYAALDSISRLLIDHALAGSDQTISKIPEDAPEVDLSDYAGSYRNNRRSFTTLTAVFSLTPSLTVSVDENALVVQQAGKTARYLALADAPDSFVDEQDRRLVFQRDAQGRVVSAADNSGVHTHARIEGRDSVLALALPAGLSLLLALTTLLGAWRRWRQQPETTGRGRLGAGLAVLAALSMGLFVVSLVAAMAGLSSMDAAGLQHFPPAGVAAARIMSWVMIGMGAALLIGLVAVWKGSGWGWWRRLHYSVFALSLCALGLQLWHWNLVGAPYI